MKYLCLVYLDETILDLHAPGESSAREGEPEACDAALRSRGRCVAAAALQPPQAVATVRVRNGRLSVAPGPCVATNRQLDRFYLIDARDLNDAIQMASRFSTADRGSVEIHPIRDIERL